MPLSCERGRKRESERAPILLATRRRESVRCGGLIGRWAAHRLSANPTRNGPSPHRQSTSGKPICIPHSLRRSQRRRNMPDMARHVPRCGVFPPRDMNVSNLLFRCIKSKKFFVKRDNGFRTSRPARCRRVQQAIRRGKPAASVQYSLSRTSSFMLKQCSSPGKPPSRTACT